VQDALLAFGYWLLALRPSRHFRPRATIQQPRALFFLFAMLGLGLLGCGYKTGGHAVTLPASVQTIAIPAFTNQSNTYRVEQVLTAAVVREFISRTHYRIVNQESSAADATLRGTVVSTQLTPVAYDSITGRAASAIIVVNMKVSLVDRHGKALFENPNYSFHDQYQISRELTSFFEEESPAVDRLSQDFARTLVSNILEAF